MPSNPDILRGFSFLIIEDEVMQAAHLADMIAGMGGTVSHKAYGFDQARDALYRHAFDCVLLDVNLGGTLSFPIVNTLQERGTPFVLCTAYADALEVYPGLAGVPRLSKPIDPTAMSEAILRVLHNWPKRRGW